MSIEANHQVDTFGLGLPPGWFTVPLDEPFERFVASHEQRLADELDAPIEAAQQRRIDLLLDRLRADIGRPDVTIAAAHIDAFEGRSSGQRIRSLITASVAVGSLSRERLGSAVGLTPSVLVTAIDRLHAEQAGVSVLAPAAMGRLPAGEAVSAVTLHHHDLDDESLGAIVQQFLLPYDRGERVAIVQFTTTTPEYLDGLAPLFIEMAKSFRLFAPGDPTDPTWIPAPRDPVPTRELQETGI